MAIVAKIAVDIARMDLIPMLFEQHINRYRTFVYINYNPILMRLIFTFTLLFLCNTLSSFSQSMIRGTITDKSSKKSISS
ncbi:MAG: hypothetical protein ACKO0Y_08235, partial [Bacteroidota bacterium]